MDGSAVDALARFARRIISKAIVAVKGLLDRTCSSKVVMSSVHAKMHLSVTVSVPKVKSTPSAPTTVTFSNRTDVIVQAWWVDYQGREVAYGKIAPATNYVQPTFKRHPWVFREANGQQLLVSQKRLVSWPEDAEASIMLIDRAKPLPWSRETHFRFPEEFRNVMKMMLLLSSKDTLGTNRAAASKGRRESMGASKKRTELHDLPSEILLHISILAAPVVPDIDYNIDLLP